MGPPTLPQPSFLYRQPPTPTNPPSAILPLQTTTNTHQPFHLTNEGWMKGWWLSVQTTTNTNPTSSILPLQTTTNTHQPSLNHPSFTDNHQHPPTLSFDKKRMDEGLVVVCTDNHQHPPTLPLPPFLYRQPPTPPPPPQQQQQQ